MPETISDTFFIEQLTTLGFTKTTIEKSKHKAINDIFRTKVHLESEFLMCAPLYRDLFIFKKKNQTVGVAKICFKCLHSQIIGTKADSGLFGQSGDYEKLEKLLELNTSARRI